MKINSVIFSEQNKCEKEYLNETFTRTASRILASQLSLQQINELIRELQLTSRSLTNN